MRGGVKSLEDKSFEVITSYNEEFNGTITTALSDYNDFPTYYFDPYLAFIDYVDEDTPPTLRVTFNNTEYVCEYNNAYGYGAPITWNDDTQMTEYDWSEYPFSLSSDRIMTQSEGTYNLVIEEQATSIQSSDAFNLAVSTIVPEDIHPRCFVIHTRQAVAGQALYELDGCNFSDIVDEYHDGSILFLKIGESELLYQLSGVSRLVVTINRFEFSRLDIEGDIANPGYYSIAEKVYSISSDGSISFSKTSYGSFEQNSQ